MLQIFKMKAVIGLLLSAAGLVLVSWLRAYSAGTLMVDGHALSGWWGATVFFAVLFALGAFSLAYYRLWADDALGINQVKLLAVVLAGLFSLMLPMLSNDIFSYMVFGDAVNKGADVYTDAQCTQVSGFYTYITSVWNSSTCAYGPFILLLAMLATALSAGKILVALVIYKMLTLLFSFVFIAVATRVCALTQSRTRNLFFILINPVFLLQGIGQLHADFIAITFAICAIYFLLTYKWQLAFIWVALSITTKMNYILLLPFFMLAVALQCNQRRVIKYGRAGVGLFLTVLAVTLAYLPFYTSVATVTTPFTFHFFQNPSKCIGEVLGDIIYFGPQIISGYNALLQKTIISSSIGGGQVFIAEIIVKICQGLALCACLYMLVKFFMQKTTLQQWFRLYVRMLLLFLLYYMHIFNPWYLMMFLPFVWMQEETAFMLWLLVLTCFISVQDMVCIITRNSIVYPVELGLTFISVMLYLYKPRRMFFTSLGY